MQKRPWMIPDQTLSPRLIQCHSLPFWLPPAGRRPLLRLAAAALYSGWPLRADLLPPLHFLSHRRAPIHLPAVLSSFGKVHLLVQSGVGGAGSEAMDAPARRRNRPRPAR
jgi:hypothetical protein